MQTRLDGPTMDVSLSGAWVVAPTIRAGSGRDRPETTRWRHERARCASAPRRCCPGASRWALAASSDGATTRTTGSRTPPASRARPDLFRARFGAQPALAFSDFSPQLSLVHELRDTNAQLYAYERTEGELRFVRVF